MFSLATRQFRKFTPATSRYFHSSSFNMAERIKTGDRLPDATFRVNQSFYFLTYYYFFFHLISFSFLFFTFISFFHFYFSFFELKILNAEGGLDTMDTSLFDGKTAVLFAIPGAFTPTCTKQHCPSFERESKTLKEKGVELVAMTAVNDAWVMEAMKEHTKAKSIQMLADADGSFAESIGMLRAPM